MPRKIYLSQDLLEDEEFQCMSDDEQRAWFLLRLDHRIGLTGMGRITQSKIAEVLRKPLDSANFVRCGLERKWCKYDPATSLLWFVGAYRLEPNSLSIRMASLREIERFPGSPLVGEWFMKYGKRWTVDAVREEERALFLELSAPYAHGTGGVTRASVDRTGPDRTGRERESEALLTPERPRARAGDERPAGKRRPRLAGSPPPGNGEQTQSRRGGGLVDRSESAKARADVYRLHLAEHAREANDIRAGVIVRELVAAGSWSDSGNPVYAHHEPERAKAELARAFGERAGRVTIEQAVEEHQVRAEVDPLEERLRRLMGGEVAS